MLSPTESECAHVTLVARAPASIVVRLIPAPSRSVQLFATSGFLRWFKILEKTLPSSVSVQLHSAVLSIGLINDLQMEFNIYCQAICGVLWK